MINTTDIFGFTFQDRKEMNIIFKKYTHLHKVVLFGSRAKNTFKKASDVDLVLYCDDESLELVSSIKYQLEEDTNIPYFFDVIHYGTLSSQELKNHIHLFGKIIYERG